MLGLFRLSNTRMFLGQAEGELATAREAYDLALEIGLERLDNPLDFPLQLANALDDSGRAEEAVDLYRETLGKAVQWYGPEDKNTLMLQFNLGLAETKLGHTDEAVARLTAAFEGLSRLQRSLVASDDMLALKGLLGACRAAGRAEEGLLWCDEHVTWFSDDFNGWLAQLARAQLLAEVGVFEEALELARPAYEKIARQLPAGHLHRVEALRTLVTSSEGLERLDEAAAYRAQLREEEAPGSASDDRRVVSRAPTPGGEDGRTRRMNARATQDRAPGPGCRRESCFLCGSCQDALRRAFPRRAGSPCPCT